MSYLSSNQAQLVLGILLSCTLYGCGGSAKARADTKTGADAQGEVPFDVDNSAWDTTDQTYTEKDTARAARDAMTGRSEGVLLGARHDLFLKKGLSATCQCLAVLLGPPDTSGMVWTGTPPPIDPSTQTVVALGSDGIGCSKPAPGASYMGFETQGTDVIVHVEAAVEGRPVTHGAVIPRPVPGGHVILHPNGDIPYGRGAGGEPNCTLVPQP